MIKIEQLLPLLKKGWVAMDKDREWYWFDDKPRKSSNSWIEGLPFSILDAFDIAPADDWKKSLIRVKGND